jgi:4-aminobutyrate aminotransferase-like enzyme
VVRLIPPLIITQKEADLALTILEEVLKKVEEG